VFPTGASGIFKQVKLGGIEEIFLDATILPQINFDRSSAFCWEGNLFAHLFIAAMMLLEKITSTF